ncbi:ATP-binding protein [bacterium]|nr:ATP-binding protein [bacterium]
MNFNSITTMKGYSQQLGARVPAEYFGREAELEAVSRLADDAQRKVARCIVFEGPAGCGMGELMKQAAVRLLARRPPMTPLWLDLAVGDAAKWIAGAIGQVLAHAGAVAFDEPLDAGRMGSLLHQANLGELAALLGGPCDEAAWRTVWRAVRRRNLPPMVLFVSGIGTNPGPARELLAAANAEKLPVVAEGPILAHGADVEYCAVEPLSVADAVALAQTVLQGCGRGFEPAQLRPILARLGPWPAWVRAWAERLRRSGKGSDWSAARLAEQTYLDFLKDSPWSRAVADGIRRAVGPARCGRALALARVAMDENRPIDAGRALQILGIEEDRFDRALAELERVGLLYRRGFGVEAPRAEAVADWARLELAKEADGARAAAAPLDLLGKHLTAARDDAATGPRIEKILELMDGQVVPEALFHLADYHEALGALPADQKRAAVMASARTVSLPEVVGVAEWRRPEQPRVVFARAYRGGLYQRSHEEVWIGIDLMDSRALTTTEIHEALAAAESLERQLGPGRYVYWLLAGADASPEALQWLHDRRVFCSAREQLDHLADLLKPAPPRMTDLGNLPKARIVGLQDEERRPATPTLTSLRREKSRVVTIPAHSESEHEAVDAAEAFAREAGFDTADVGRIKTAVLEGVLNAIEHSSDPEKLVRVELVLTAQALEILIDNEGPSFDPLAVAEPDPVAKLKAVNKRGWGISLMKRFMDEVGYEAIAGGTRLRLVKRRPQGGRQSAAREVIETGASHS